LGPTSRFVEMLESHHSLVIKALQRLYKLCASKEGFPGEPLVETSDGYPLTHAILDRLGLIKQAEDSSQGAPSEETEDLHYLRMLQSSTDCSATTDPSPEPVTPSDPVPRLTSPIQLSPVEHDPIKWEFQSIQPQSVQPEPPAYHGYPQTEYRGVTLPPPILDIPALATESKCATVGPVAGLAHAYLYCCNPHSTDNLLHPAVTTGPAVLPLVSAAGMPLDLVENYGLHIPDRQPIYQPSLQSTWAYPCE
jgi:hypothetical protein